MSVLMLVNQVAQNAIIGSITTKLFDTVINSKLVQKNEKKKWVREKKLNLFSQLSEEILTINSKNINEKQKMIREISSKIILLTENQKLKTNLENYTFILDEYEYYKTDINLQHLNKELIQILSSYMKRI